MSEETNEPVAPSVESVESVEPTPVEPVETPAATTKPRFQDRVLGMKAVAGVALASVVLGGAGGAALGAISDGEDDNGRGTRFGGPTTNFQGPGGGQMMPPGMQGQLPPGLPPQQNGSTDDQSGDQSGNSTSS